MKFVVEPGDFEVLVGGSSRDEDLQKATFTTVERPPAKLYLYQNLILDYQ